MLNLAIRIARIVVLLCAAALPTVLAAQDSQRSRPPNTYHAPKTSSRPRVPFPDMHPDRTVTFRITAPDAREVALRLEGARDGEG
jgi:hypothetical protein